MIKICNDCQKLSVDPMFCLHCGSANIEPVNDNLPWIDDLSTPVSEEMLLSVKNFVSKKLPARKIDPLGSNITVLIHLEKDDLPWT